MKKNILKILTIFLLLLTISSCGITEELDAAQRVTEDLQEELSQQQAHYKKMNQLMADASSWLTSNVTTNEDARLFTSNEGSIYENLEARAVLLKEMEKVNKQIQRNKDKLELIEKKKAVDVANKDLKKIPQSLAILDSNLAAMKAYLTTGMEQEKELYQDLDDDAISNTIFTINQTYSSLYVLLEEAPANTEYSLKITRDFLRAQTKK